MDARADSLKRFSRRAIDHAWLALVTAMVIVAVAVVPLLLNLGSLEDTYYSAKARALVILAPVLVLGVFMSSGISQMRRARLLWPLLAFAGAAILATALSVNPRWSISGAPQRDEGLLALLGYAAICAGTVVVVARGWLALWHSTGLACGTLVAAYGVAQYFGLEWLVRDPIRAFWWRPFSTSGNPNFLGAYMVLVAPLAVAAVVNANRKWVTALSWLSLGVIVLAALCTYSRATWLGLAMAAVVFVGALRVQPGLRNARRMQHRLLGAFALVATLTALFFIPGSPLAIPRADWPAAQRARTAIAPQDPNAGFRQRWYLWGQTLSLLRKRPVLGYGPETFVLVFPQGWGADRTQLFGDLPVRIDKAHNDTLDLAMSTGVVGVAAFWWVVVSAVRGAASALTLGGEERVLAAACITAIAGYWIDVQWHFSVVSVAPVFWSVMGAAAGMAVGRPRSAP